MDVDSVSVSEDLNAMRVIGDKIRRFVFTEGNRVSKTAGEFILNCVSEYECQLVSMLAKNERLCGRLEECEKRMRQGVDVTERRSFASVAGRSVPASKGVSAKGANVESGRTFAIVVKSKDESVKMSSDEVKKKVMRDVSSKPPLELHRSEPKDTPSSADQPSPSCALEVHRVWTPPARSIIARSAYERNPSQPAEFLAANRFIASTDVRQLQTQGTLRLAATLLCTKLRQIVNRDSVNTVEYSVTRAELDLLANWPKGDIQTPPAVPRFSFFYRNNVAGRNKIGDNGGIRKIPYGVLKHLRARLLATDNEVTGLHQKLQDEEKQLQKDRKQLEAEREELERERKALEEERYKNERLRHEIEAAQATSLRTHDTTHSLSAAIERIDATNMSVNRALDSLPPYGGTNMTVISYCQALRRARDMLTPDAEATFVRLPGGSLKGRAYRAIEGCYFISVAEVFARLKAKFDRPHCDEIYRGQLALVKQEPNESIAHYVNRVKDLRSAILEYDHVDMRRIDYH
ncbi:hypothetical protein WN48_06681 [Eufriesea mexicana]|uniref:Retrotransposon gag domain-containing protein n=1 Tax=Eufriesea mexicana TaxID=516756 RepID=A0A310SLA6_9HYME|nr:hypothetical protein WN48_06681 [Eufriesea mexicana]